MTPETKPKPFAKLFDSDKHGQLLAVLRDEDDDEGNRAKVVLTFDVGIALCDTTLGYKTIENATTAFDSLTKERFEGMVVQFKKQFEIE